MSAPLQNYMLRKVRGAKLVAMKPAYLLLWGCLCLMPLAASAQWQWIDNGGRKVFSDQPPPDTIPEKNILRRAGGAPAPRSPTFPTPTDAPTAAASAPRIGANQAAGVDKALEEKARKAEEAEKAKQAAEAQKVAQAKAENCGRARQGKATFDSGIRVARINAQGEREIMDDGARNAEQKRLQSVIESDCK